MHLIPMSFLFLSLNCGAEVFNSKINFWDEPKVSEEKPIEQPPLQTSEKEPKDSTRFEWKKYMNPENDEFFCENKNSCPPAPFMEVYRRPTKENVLMWNKYVQKRNEIHKRGTLAIQSLLGKAPLVKSQIEEMQQEASAVPNINVSPEQVSFLFYFDANCPNCKAMYKTVNDLLNRGYYVEAIRLDHTSSVVEGLGLAWSEASPEEVKKLQITATPLLAIIDSRSKKVLKITGYQTTESIFQSIQQKL